MLKLEKEVPGRRPAPGVLAIVDSNDARMHGLLLRVCDHGEPGGHASIKLAPGSHFQLLPNCDPKRRDTLFIAGGSGVGKSTLAGSFVRKFVALHDAPTYLVCGASGEKDPAFADLFASGKMQQIPVAELDGLDLEQGFPTKMCCVVDDIESSTRKELELVERVQKGLLCLGRKPCWTTLILGHMLTDGLRTKYQLAESDKVIVFPRQTLAGALTYLCVKKLGFTNDQVKQLRALPTRWACICKSNVPAPLVISESEAYML